MSPEKNNNKNLIPDMFQAQIIKTVAKILYYLSLVRTHTPWPKEEEQMAVFIDWYYAEKH